MRWFTLTELTRSETATRKGIENMPTAEHEHNLDALIKNVLDPLREVFGSPIQVTSGYRGPALNKAVGGAKNSHHCRGMAADIIARNGDNARMFDIARRMLPFTQLIWEKGNDTQPAWVHISYDPADLRHEIHKTRDGKNYTRIV